MGNECKPYVGVSGISTVKEARKVISIFKETGFNLKARSMPMVGLQLLSESLGSVFGASRRSPDLEQLPDILKLVNLDVFSTIHYSTADAWSFVKDIEAILNIDEIYEQGLVGGLQINRILPSEKQVQKLRDNYPKLKLILQISPIITDTINIHLLSKRLATSYPKFDYLLIDASLGTGTELNENYCSVTYRAIRENGVTTPVVFAGGLSGSNVRSKVNQLKNSIKEGFSIDAEGSLRDKLGEGYGNDVLNMEKVSAYLAGASEMLLK